VFCVALAGAIAYVCLRAPSGRTDAPPAGANAGNLPAGFTGSSSCKECHADFYSRWSMSHHGLAMQPYTPAFGQKELRAEPAGVDVRKVRYTVGLTADKGWMVGQDAGGVKKYEIVHAMGGKNVYYLLTPLERGKLQVMPLAYDVRKKTWFDTTASATRHFGNPDDEILDWRERPLTFNTACFGCHVSHLSKNYDLTTDSYKTVWGEPGIACETCHGPAKEHVRLFRSLPAGQTGKDIKIISTKTFTVEQRNATCASCHAKAAPITMAFKPGDRFFDHFDLSAYEHPDFYPDGRDLGENYTYTSWRRSPCAKSGKLDCLYCHTSSGRYRFADEKANDACVPCHADVAARVAEHSGHETRPDAPTCVQCHMPMTNFARMNRSDHSMLPPTPLATQQYKSPNACDQCHKDEGIEWELAAVKKMWPKRDYQAPVLQRAALIDAARKDDWSRLPDMLTALQDPQRDEVFTVSLLRLLRQCRDARKWPVMLGLASDASPWVRCAAMETLDANGTEAAVATLLKGVTDESRLVRTRAAAALAGYPRGNLAARAQSALEAATAEYVVSLQARPDDAASHYNLGNYYVARQEVVKALAAYDVSLRLDPDNVMALVNAAIARSTVQQNDVAMKNLEAAHKLAPKNGVVNLNYGMLLAELGRMTEAEQAFRRVLEADPHAAAAAYNLSVLLAEKQPAEALGFAKRAVELSPDDPKCGYTLAFYQHQNGDLPAAIATLEGLVLRKVAGAREFELLGQSHEQLGHPDKAIAVYREALNARSVGPRERAFFAARLEALNKK